MNAVPPWCRISNEDERVVRVGQIEALESLIEGAYAAALDDGLWVDWADQFLAELGGSFGSFFAFDTSTNAVKQLIHLRTPENVEEQYYAYRMEDLDPQIPYVASRSGSGFYVDTDHVDLTDPGTAEFMRWLTNNVGMQHHMTTFARLNGGRLHAGVSVHRTVTDGPTPLAEQRKLAAILPEITRAMNLGFVHSQKLLDAYWTGLSANLNEPALLLDEQGKVLRLTVALSDLLASHDGLDIGGGRLRACTPIDDNKLQAIISRATTRAAPRSGAMRARRPSGLPPLLVTVYPIARATRVLAPAEASALVIVVDPITASGAPNPLWRDIFEFTPRESELAKCLMAGHSLESSAASLNTTMHTVRVHLRRLFAKTGVARQAELVRLLAKVR